MTPDRAADVSPRERRRVVGAGQPSGAMRMLTSVTTKRRRESFSPDEVRLRTCAGLGTPTPTSAARRQTAVGSAVLPAVRRAREQNLCPSAATGGLGSTML